MHASGVNSFPYVLKDGFLNVDKLQVYRVTGFFTS